MAPLLARHRASLDGVEDRIASRNRERAPYVHLLPSRIPPGINI